MQTRTNGYGIVDNPLTISPFGTGTGGSGFIPPTVTGAFLLMTGANFLLMSGADFLLMG